MRIETWMDLQAIKNGIVSIEEMPAYVERLSKSIGRDVVRMSKNGLNYQEILYFLTGNQN